MNKDEVQALIRRARAAQLSPSPLPGSLSQSRRFYLQRVGRLVEVLADVTNELERQIKKVEEDYLRRDAGFGPAQEGG